MNIQDEVNQVVTHELIHAFDDCRAGNLDWANCAHHACSEVCVSVMESLNPLIVCVCIFFFFFKMKEYASIVYMKQIRAGHLSGDCHYKREFLRGYMKIRGHEQVSYFFFGYKMFRKKLCLYFTLLPPLLADNIGLSLFNSLAIFFNFEGLQRPKHLVCKF